MMDYMCRLVLETHDVMIYFQIDNDQLVMMYRRCTDRGQSLSLFFKYIKCIK